MRRFILNTNLDSHSDSLINQIDLVNLSSFEYEMLGELLSTNHDIECVCTLYSYSKDILNNVLSFCCMGYDIINLVLIEDSDWYVNFLLECLSNRIDLNCLLDKNLDYSQVYNLACCLCLGYNVKSLLENKEIDLKKVNKQFIINYFVNSGKNNVYVVELIDDYVINEDESYTVISPSIRDAKLISCIEGLFNPFHIKVKCYDLTSINPSIIHISKLI